MLTGAVGGLIGFGVGVVGAGALITGAVGGGLIGGAGEALTQMALYGQIRNPQLIGAAMLSGVVSGGVFGAVGYGVRQWATQVAAASSRIGGGATAAGGGVTAQQVAQNESQGIGGTLRGFTKHGINQVINRGVRPYEILDALRNPVRVLPGRGDVTRYIGKWAEVRLNSLGQVVTVIRFKPPGAP